MSLISNNVRSTLLSFEARGILNYFELNTPKGPGITFKVRV